MNLGGARPSTHFRITAPADFPCFFYVFDVMVLEGVDLRREPLSRLRELLEEESPAEIQRTRKVFLRTGGGSSRLDRFPEAAWPGRSRGEARVQPV